MGNQITGSNLSIKMDYVEPLFKMIINQLKNDNIENILEIFNFYNLNPDILKENLTYVQFNP